MTASLEKASFTISEVAKLFGISVQTVHYWLKAGKISQVERASQKGPYLIPRAAVVRILEERWWEVPGLSGRSLASACSSSTGTAVSIAWPARFPGAQFSKERSKGGTLIKRCEVRGYFPARRGPIDSFCNIVYRWKRADRRRLILEVWEFGLSLFS